MGLMTQERAPECTQKAESKYDYKIFWPAKEPYNPDNECVDVIVKVNGKEYAGTVLTPDFLKTMFEKNAQTGECAGGRYFAMPRMIIVKRIDDETIRATLDELIANGEFEDYFKH